MSNERKLLIGVKLAIPVRMNGFECGTLVQQTNVGEEDEKPKAGALKWNERLLD